MILFWLLMGILCFCCCWAWVKFVNWIIPEPKKKPGSNPCIAAQMMPQANDKLYNDSLIWMDETNTDLPSLEQLKNQENHKI